jgi:ribosomal RNA assembly protein
MRVFVLPTKRLERLKKDSGRALKDLEKKGGVKIAVKEEGDYATLEITGESEGEWVAGQVLAAIDLGFQPKQALKLFGENIYLETIDLGEAMHGKENAVTRMKSRIIGSEGRIRKALEELSEAAIAISDDSRVGLLGGFEEVKAAKEAVLRLLEGNQHGGVITYLRNEKRKREAQSLGIKL